MLDPGPIAQYQRAVWDPSGRRVVFSGAERERPTRLFVQEASQGPPRAVTPEGVELLRTGKPVSPDGRHVVAVNAEGTPMLFPLAGGDPVGIPGLGESDVPIAWTPDGRELLVAHYDETPPRVEWMDIATGRSRPWSSLGRGTASGLIGDYRLLITPDGEAHAYTFVRAMSALYLSSRVR